MSKTFDLSADDILRMYPGLKVISGKCDSCNGEMVANIPYIDAFSVALYQSLVLVVKIHTNQGHFNC